MRIFQEVDHFSKTKIQPTHKIELAKVEFQAMLNHNITKLNIVKTEVYVKTEVQETLPETENPPIKSVDNWKLSLQLDSKFSPNPEIHFIQES